MILPGPKMRSHRAANLANLASLREGLLLKSVSHMHRRTWSTNAT